MKKQMPYTVVIGVDMPTKVRFVFGRCEKNSASGIRIRQAEVIPWIITGMLMPRPLKYPMLLNSTQVRTPEPERKTARGRASSPQSQRAALLEL